MKWLAKLYGSITGADAEIRVLEEKLKESRARAKDLGEKLEGAQRAWINEHNALMVLRGIHGPRCNPFVDGPTSEHLAPENIEKYHKKCDPKDVL